MSKFSDEEQVELARIQEYHANKQKIKLLEQQLQQARRHATEEVAQAHKRGWEQCQKESVYIATKYLTNSVGEKIADAIASMEYKEVEND